MLGEIGKYCSERRYRTAQDRPQLIGNRPENHVRLTVAIQAMTVDDALDGTSPHIGFHLPATLQAEPVLRRRADSTEHELTTMSETRQLGRVSHERVTHGAIVELPKRRGESLGA
jgi:hypothetical protein